MRPIVTVAADPQLLTELLSGYARAAATIIRQGTLPPLYASGVRYRREPPGRERWQLPPETLRRRFGDCEDLSIWRAGELLAAGRDAWPVVYRSGPRTLHVVVDRGGWIEDPSRALGMGARKRRRR